MALTPRRRSLVRKVMTKSIASSTAQQYERRWTQWTDYCHLHNLPIYRPELENLLGYLAVVSEHSSVNVVYHHISAINHYHRVELLPPPSDHELVCTFMRGLKRLELEKNLPNISRAKPITPDILRKLSDLTNGNFSFVTYFYLFVHSYILYFSSTLSPPASHHLEDIRLLLLPLKMGRYP